MLRDYPYPTRGAVTICSDVDGSPDLETYLEVVRFLNGTGPTALGKGLGLEIGNSFYFDNDHPSRFSYWSTSDEGRDVIRELIRSGHIDCLHSFGESSTSREQAILALDELQKHDCFLEVWVNHSKTPTNISSPSMPGQGDFPGDVNQIQLGRRRAHPVLSGDPRTRGQENGGEQEKRCKYPHTTVPSVLDGGKTRLNHLMGSTFPME